MSEFKTNLAGSQKFQTRYHNKHVKKRTYRPGGSVILKGENVKTKRNLKLEHKYLSPFEIFEAVSKKAYCLKLPPKQRIYPSFYVLFSEREVTRKKAVDRKIVKRFMFENTDQPEQQVNSILNSEGFAEEATDGKLPELYFLIEWKRETHAEGTCEPVEGICHLRQLNKKNHADYRNNPIITSPLMDQEALPTPMAARLGVQPASTIAQLHIYSVIKNRLQRSKRHQKSFRKG